MASLKEVNTLRLIFSQYLLYSHICYSIIKIGLYTIQIKTYQYCF